MKHFFSLIICLCFSSGIFSQQCIMWFEGSGAQPLGQPHQGCAPCNVATVYTLKSTGPCSSSCLNLFYIASIGGLHIDNATSYTILGPKTISITWGCGDAAGVIYTTCNGDFATAINICTSCNPSLQYCLAVTCDTLCVTLAGNSVPVVISAPSTTAVLYCFNQAISGVSQYPCIDITKPRAGENNNTTDGSSGFVIPNPTTETIRVVLPEEFTGTETLVQIFDINGNEAYSGKFPRDQPQVEINAVNWDNGIYLVRLKNDNHMKSQKVALQH